MLKKRAYETTFIVNPGLEDSGIDGIVQAVEELITNNGGEIVVNDRWGRKRLAYPIQKKNNGYYVYLMYNAPATLQSQMERHFHLEENVMRHLTIILEKGMLQHRMEYLEERGLLNGGTAKEEATTEA